MRLYLRITNYILYFHDQKLDKTFELSANYNLNRLKILYWMKNYSNFIF